jgi:ubiquinone/menaquinone biosynthesis C-methylase UbiE
MGEPAAEPDIRRYYEDTYCEADRLSGSPHGRAEFTRTQELLRRLLPPPPAVVLDVGGGPGAHARWLAGDGYTVHLIDLVLVHARAARSSAAVTASVGDARRLPAGDATADAVLLLGPLYHLIERADRLTALREAARVTRPGGMVIAAGISRNAALMDLTVQGCVTAANFPGLLEAYATGRNDGRIGFTTAYFHSPSELADDVTAAGLGRPQVLGIEGPLWPALDAVGAQLTDPMFGNAMACARAFETDPAIMGASAHLLAAVRVGEAGPADQPEPARQPET